MSLEFMDGFDHLATADLTLKWDTNTNAISTSIVAGRYAAYAVQQGAGGASSPKLIKTLSGGSRATRVIGMAVRFYNSFDNAIICGFQDAGSFQLELRRTSGGYFTVTRNGTVLETSTATYSLSTWYYIEFKATIDSSTGSYEVRLNGTNILSDSGVNTQATANASANQVFVGGNPGAPVPVYQQVDDLYVVNTDGSANNDFLGECRIFTNMPTGDSGTNKQWSRSTGTNNYPLVDEANQNGDTDYVYDSTVGDIDTYTFGAISPTGGIAAVAVNLCARKDDAGTRQIAEETRQSSTEYTGTTKTLTSSYTFYQNIREVDPATALAWTGSGVNAAEMGVKVIA